MKTEAEAVALYESRWWIDAGAHEIVREQLYEDRLLLPFAVYHVALEHILGRPVWVHEFASPIALQTEYERVSATW